MGNFKRDKGLVYSKLCGYYSSKHQPLQIIISHMYLSNGNLNLGPLPTVIPNFPFILFWVALAGNFYFVVRLLKTAGKIV